MRRARPIPRVVPRAAMTQALAARREALRARLSRRKPIQRKREPRRRWWWLLLLLVLLLLLLFCCCPAVPPVVEDPPAVPLSGAGEPAVPVEVPAPLTGRVDRRARPDFATAPPGPLPWLATFRLQVTARSPRLAECFAGVQRPGTLKWTADVEPSSGRVSDATLETTLQSDPLTAEQRACALGVLSEPPYRLDAEGEERSTPSRVSLAIEF